MYSKIYIIDLIIICIKVDKKLGMIIVFINKMYS